MPGGNTIREYYDGTKDKRLNYQLQAKVTTANRQRMVEGLTELTDQLDDLEELESSDGSFDFGQITVGNELYFADADDGYTYFRLDFQPELTIYKREDNE